MVFHRYKMQPWKWIAQKGSRTVCNFRIFSWWYLANQSEWNHVALFFMRYSGFLYLWNIFVWEKAAKIEKIPAKLCSLLFSLNLAKSHWSFITLFCSSIFHNNYVEFQSFSHHFLLLPSLYNPSLQFSFFFFILHWLLFSRLLIHSLPFNSKKMARVLPTL